jgi:hypothetical protein
MLNWTTLTPLDRRNCVTELQTMRVTLLEQAKQRRVSKKRKSTVKKIEFKSRELEEFFNEAPPELAQFLKGR